MIRKGRHIILVISCPVLEEVRVMWLGESLRYSEEDLMHLTLGFIGSYDPKYTSLSLYKKPGEVEEAAVVVGGEAGAGRTWRDWRGGERRGRRF